MDLHYKVVRVDRKTPDGRDLTHYEIRGVSVMGAVRLNKRYPTEDEALSALARMNNRQH